MDAVDHKCPACSASLPFDPTTGKWKCTYCASEYTLEELNKYEEEAAKRKEEVKETKPHKHMDVDEYSCPNCGAKIMTDENTTATFCVYCGSTSIIKNRLLGVLQPNFVIPFSKTKQDAIRAFEKCKKGKLFAPSEFTKKEQIDKITGVYIPFWLYDCNTNASIEGEATKVTSWSTGDYRYTKTDIYNVARAGNALFDKVPVDGSKKFDDDTMDSIEPFNYNDLKEFSPSYLSGFLAEKYDVDDKEAFSRAELRMKNTIRNELKSTASTYTTFNIRNEHIDIDQNKINYVLFPVWMLNIKYNGKMHTFAMNGQTGKMVGNIPISGMKAFLWMVGMFGIVFLIAYLIMMMF
ncbi:MAG: DNA helicase PriA [Clostridia bacterium]|nr:DNA helicase PriA [Clostridia bacterium]